VGVICYILLSGTMPFDDDSRARLYRLILRAMYNYNGVVSPPPPYPLHLCILLIIIPQILMYN